MNHYFECGGIAYKIIPLTLLNETDRTTEPKFTVTCQSVSLLEFFLIVALLVLLLSIPGLFEIFQRRMPFTYAWITTVLCNILVLIHNLFNRQDPAEYWPLPKREWCFGHGDDDDDGDVADAWTEFPFVAVNRFFVRS
ncbi:hypothetical protein KI688_008796 [Linnemannia hyalina]|uniref:Uncharacterized protein n=1 Tax=Linnemannia hyalina TaxID=64524 RepID=A0A9P7Y1I6_9FUNG|nr:hypothetical protein KI688_008796 [Linnemannia hyalina]